MVMADGECACAAFFEVRERFGVLPEREQRAAGESVRAGVRRGRGERAPRPLESRLDIVLVETPRGPDAVQRLRRLGVRREGLAVAIFGRLVRLLSEQCVSASYQPTLAPAEPHQRRRESEKRVRPLASASGPNRRRSLWERSRAMRASSIIVFRPDHKPKPDSRSELRPLPD